jgi:hypothetical protein
MNNPKTTDPIISALFKIPETEKESLIKMVDNTKPEFLMIV